MNRFVLSAVGRAVLVVVLVLSGWYTARSLYVWEWQRALFYALAFLASLVVVVFLLLQRRLDRLERRLATRPEPHATPAEKPGEDIPAAPDREFAWLTPGEGTYVFIPLLVGFGVAVSAVAIAVERIAGFIVGPGGEDDPRQPDGAPRQGRRTRQRATRSVRAAAVAVLGVLAMTAVVLPFVDDVTYAPEAPQPGQRAIELQVRAKRVEVDPVATVTSLAEFCRTQTRIPVVVDAVEPTGPQTVRLVVHPRLHSDDERRFEGCLGDLSLDWHLISVVGVTDVGPGSSPPPDRDDDGQPVASSASRDTST